MKKELENKRSVERDDLIEVEHGDVQKIADMCGVHRVTVSKALKGDSRVHKYQYIRAVARNRDGSRIYRSVESINK